MGMIAFGDQAFQETPDQRDEVIRTRLHKALGDKAEALASNVDIDTLRILVAAKKSAEASGLAGSLLETLKGSGLIVVDDAFSTEL